MAYPPPFESAPASLQIVTDRPGANPRDVAELFDWLDVENLRYREFQLPDELSTPNLRPSHISSGFEAPRRIVEPTEMRPMLVERATGSR
jgi:hypothetical protein